MHTSPAEFIGLTARGPYLDDTNAHSDSHLSVSDTLLEDDSDSLNENFQQRPKWRTLFSSKITNRARRKPSKPGNIIREKMILGKRKGSGLYLKVGLGILILLGVIQLLSLIGSLVVLVLPHGVHKIVDSWGRPGHIGANLASWPTDFSRDITPIRCHSHNDYWRRVPLYSAIEAGCIGVEADIWLFQDELFVGHSVASLTPNRTLNSLYIYPLLDILSKQNPKHTLIPERDPQIHGVFDTDPEQTLIFLIDFKTAGAALWPYVQSALEPLRKQNYLTRANGTEIIPGPITVVGTGNTPFDLVDSDTSNPHHDIFFDSPLADMYEDPNSESLPLGTSPPEATSKEVMPAEAPSTGDATKMERRSDEEGQGKSGTTSGNPDAYNTGNSYYASVAFSEAIGQLWDGKFSEDQLDKLRGQIRGAHKRRLKARYWDLPFWPISLRNYVWDVLVKEGVDLLNVDDLKGATKRNWNKHYGWWKRMKSVSYDVNGGIDVSIEGPAGAAI